MKPLSEQKKTESQFVDYETAKMLKELGFNELTISFYFNNGDDGFVEGYVPDSPVCNSKLYNPSQQDISRPLWQQAEEWLWEKHEIVIRVIYDSIIFHSIIGRKNFSVIDTLKIDFDSPITAKIEGIKQAIKYIHSKK